MLCTKHAKLAGLSAGNKQSEGALLASTIRSVLATAAAKGMESVAMPLIGTGVAGWPKQLAAELCLTEVSLFLRAGPSSLKVTVMVSCPVVAVYIVTCCSKRQRCKNPKVSRFVGQQPLLPPRIISKQLVHCLALPCLHFLSYFCGKLHHWVQAPPNPLLPPPPPRPLPGFPTLLEGTLLAHKSCLGPWPPLFGKDPARDQHAKLPPNITVCAGGQICGPE